VLSLQQQLGRSSKDLGTSDSDLPEMLKRYREAADQRRQLHPQRGRLVRGLVLVSEADEEGRGGGGEGLERKKEIQITKKNRKIQE
jgi:hypothetical protein